MTPGTVVGFGIGVGLFFAIRIGIEDMVWRLRGKPCCGFKPPMKIGNLVSRRYVEDWCIAIVVGVVASVAIIFAIVAAVSL